MSIFNIENEQVKIVTRKYYENLFNLFTARTRARLPYYLVLVLGMTDDQPGPII
jgi:hypothetical protein